MRVLFRKDVDGSSGDVYYEQYAGLSSETKPTMNIATGSEFFEVDTGKKYKFDEASGLWIEWAGSNGAAESEGFLTVNNLDAVSGGKYNVLQAPYTSTDVMDGKQILSAGSIGDKASTSVSPLIPVSEGTYGLKTAHNVYSIGQINDGNSYKNGYSFFASDGTTVVSRPDTLLHSVATDIYVFDVPEGAAYVRFGYTSGGSEYYATALEFFNQWVLLPNANENIDASFFILSPKKQNGEISQLKRIDGSIMEIVDAKAREDIEAMPPVIGRRSFAIFQKVCCIGDSFTAGYIMNSSGTAVTAPEYSWPTHLANMTGREYVNCGVSGATTASWLSNSNGLAKAQVAANKAQAYVIGLQINDVANELSVGTSADIGTTAQSYYGYTSKIIDEIFTINSAAHVFLLTQPKNYTGTHTPYREAVLSIADYYQENGNHTGQVHLIDLLDYHKLFDGCVEAMANGHYTASGWEYVAEIMMYALSDYINKNPDLFQDVNLIPFGTAT